MWHTTKMLGGTCAPTTHPQFYIMPTKCLVAGHLFTSLLPYTPLFNIMQINCHRQNMSSETPTPTWDSSYQERLFWDIHEMSHPQHKPFKTRSPRWKQCCDKYKKYTVYSYVAMVTIQEVLLWLTVVISGIESFQRASKNSPFTHPQFCIRPTKLSCGRSWVVYKFAYPTHPLFNIVKIIVIVKTCHLKHGFPADMQFLSSEIILRHTWNDGNNVVTTVHRWFTLPAHMFTVMLLW